jgi:hypothetical protein
MGTDSMNSEDKEKVVKCYTYEMRYKTFSPEDLVRNIINEVEVAEKMEWEERTKYDFKMAMAIGAMIMTVLIYVILRILKVI